MPEGKARITLSPFTISAKAFVSLDAVVAVQHPLPDDHPFYVLIGRVTAEWARLEHNLDLIIWDPTKSSNKVISCLTGQITSYTSRIRAISALAHLYNYRKDILKEIAGIEGRLHGLADERNRYTHDAWFIQSTEGHEDDVNEVGQFKSVSKKNKKFGFHPIDEIKVTDFIRKVNALTTRVTKLRNKILQQ